MSRKGYSTGPRSCNHYQLSLDCGKGREFGDWLGWRKKKKTTQLQHFLIYKAATNYRGNVILIGCTHVAYCFQNMSNRRGVWVFSGIWPGPGSGAGLGRDLLVQARRWAGAGTMMGQELGRYGKVQAGRWAGDWHKDRQIPHTKDNNGSIACCSPGVASPAL